MSDNLPQSEAELEKEMMRAQQDQISMRFLLTKEFWFSTLFFTIFNLSIYLLIYFLLPDLILVFALLGITMISGVGFYASAFSRPRVTSTKDVSFASHTPNRTSTRDEGGIQSKMEQVSLTYFIYSLIPTALIILFFELIS